MIKKNGSKSIPISKRMVWEAYQKVRANGGSAGTDEQSIEEFEANLSGNGDSSAIDHHVPELRTLDYATL
jgi:hypothetical protein